MARPAKTVNDTKAPVELPLDAEKEVNAPEKQETKAPLKKAEEKKDNNGLPFTVKDGRVSCRSESRKGKKIIAATGKEITFDGNGKAEIDLADALYLKDCSGFTFE